LAGIPICVAVRPTDGHPNRGADTGLAATVLAPGPRLAVVVIGALVFITLDDTISIDTACIAIGRAGLNAVTIGSAGVGVFRAAVFPSNTAIGETPTLYLGDLASTTPGRNGITQDTVIVEIAEAVLSVADPVLVDVVAGKRTLGTLGPTHTPSAITPVHHLWDPVSSTWRHGGCAHKGDIVLITDLVFVVTDPVTIRIALTPWRVTAGSLRRDIYPRTLSLTRIIVVAAILTTDGLDDGLTTAL